MNPVEQARPQTSSERLLPLSDEQWHHIATAIDTNPDIADRAQAPDGRSLRDAFRAALSTAVELAAQSTPGKIRAELKRCERKLSQVISGMSPDARDAWREHFDCWMDFQEGLAESWGRFDKDQASIKCEKPIGIFLSQVVGLVCLCEGIAQTLPGKELSDDNLALNYPLVRAARAAVGVALELAEQHKKAALPVLRRINRCAMSVFVEHVRRARHKRSIPLDFVA
jgi:hypothetical protein